ncbi:AAA family ATPase [Alkalilimnicola ehrlichii MLHE-1]|nr:bifunctional aminoglycoside phosphotransferase/ATP-binding protein [Alkalilimnicola ehrlichii]
METQAELLAALRNPRVYPWPAEGVEVIETHISTVFLAGDHVLKIKKPLDLGFLDFSTLERRAWCCEEEVRLNSRLAPDWYLRAVPITGRADAPALEGDGEPLEWGVLMRRFPQSALMDARLERGELPVTVMEDLARVVAEFHAEIPGAGPDTDYGSVDSVLAPMLQNFEQLRGLEAAGADPAALDALEAWTQAQGDELEELIDSRFQGGFVRECHGDLHLGNIAWHEGQVIVFDAIEFEPYLRWIDVANEVAFVIMDLDHRGASDHRHRFLNAYLEHTGDYGMVRLLRFYAAYRAMVRAKINGFMASQAEAGSDARQAARQRVTDYMALAQRYTQLRRPELVITHGLSGAGKTRVAGELVAAEGHLRLRSDVERKRLFGLSPDARRDDEPEQGLYTAEATERTYSHLEGLAREMLEAGWSVVVDAAFLDPRHRQAFRDLAEELECDFRILAVQARPEVLRERVKARADAGGDASDATLTVLEHQLADYEPLSEAEAAVAEVVRTDG